MPSTNSTAHTAGAVLSVAQVKRIVNKAIREVCRSKPIEHEAFQTIRDLHPNQIERNLIEAVKRSLAAAAKGGAK